MYDNIKITSDYKAATIKTRAMLLKYVYSLKKKTAKTTTVTVYKACFLSADVTKEVELIEKMSYAHVYNTIKNEEKLNTKQKNEVLLNYIMQKYNVKITADLNTDITACLQQIDTALNFTNKFNYATKLNIEINNDVQKNYENFDLTKNKVYINSKTEAHVIVHEFMHAFLYEKSLNKYCLISEIMGQTNNNKIEKFNYSLQNETPFLQEMRIVLELQNDINNIVKATTSRVAVLNSDANEVFCNIASFLFYYTNRKNMERPVDLFYVRKEDNDFIQRKINFLQQEIESFKNFDDALCNTIYKSNKNELIVSRQAKIIQLQQEMTRDVSKIMNEEEYCAIVAEPFCRTIVNINANYLTLKKHFDTLNKRGGYAE